jgi:hypothetical protein
MHTLVEAHGQPGWVAVLTRLSVDGMIVAASTTLLADSRSGGRGGFLPWGAAGGGKPGEPGRERRGRRAHHKWAGDCAWPSFALIAAYELLMRQIRRSAAVGGKAQLRKPDGQISRREAPEKDLQCPRKHSS